jgi:hypothetical protein
MKRSPSLLKRSDELLKQLAFGYPVFFLVFSATVPGEIYWLAADLKNLTKRQVLNATPQNI